MEYQAGKGVYVAVRGFWTPPREKRNKTRRHLSLSFLFHLLRTNFTSAAPRPLLQHPQRGETVTFTPFSPQSGLFVGSVNPFGPTVAVQREGQWRYVPNARGGCEVWLGSPGAQS